MRKGDLFPIASPYSVTSRILAKDHRIQYTGEKRCAKKGEWYLSGAITEGYKAPNDLNNPFHIGKLVKVKVETVITVVEEL